MKKKELRTIMKKHLSIEKEDTFDYSDIPSSPLFKKKTQPRRNIPAWVGALAGAAAMFLFMLTPIGKAIPEVIYNTNHYLDSETNTVKSDYTGKTSKDSNSTLYEDNFRDYHIFNNIQEAQTTFPQLTYIKNSYYVPTKIEIYASTALLHINYDYIDKNGTFLSLSNAISYTDTGQGLNITIEGDSQPFTTTFNNGTIEVNGSHSPNSGYAVAYDKNCEYTFRCKDIPLEEFMEFIEGCYLE